MADRTLLFIGGPDAGKTNYLARLWLALQRGGGVLQLPSAPEDITYVERALAHLLAGRFAPRSAPDDGPRDFQAHVVVHQDGDAETVATILVPDTLGELWDKAVSTREIDAEWMDRMRRCEGAALFVRIDSDQIKAPLDWVTARELMKHGLTDGEGAERHDIPTQVFLCELLKYLEMTLSAAEARARPRVAVVVTAWDLLDGERASMTPFEFLEAEFPMFAGRIDDTTRLDVRVFGSSVLGGDLCHDDKFSQHFHDRDPETYGYIVISPDGVTSRRAEDLTLPIAWLLGVDDREIL